MQKFYKTKLKIFFSIKFSANLIDYIDGLKDRLYIFCNKSKSLYRSDVARISTYHT